jgi:predicted DNA-binding transcriptional regulator AlpA
MISSTLLTFDSAAASLPLTELPPLVPAVVAGPICGRAPATWWRDHATACCPAPVRIGGRILWLTQELREWVAAGCPNRPTWEAIKATRRKCN